LKGHTSLLRQTFAGCLLPYKEGMAGAVVVKWQLWAARLGAAFNFV